MEHLLPLWIWAEFTIIYNIGVLQCFASPCKSERGRYSVYLIIPQEPGHSLWLKLSQPDVAAWDLGSGASDSGKQGQLGAMVTIARFSIDGSGFL